LPSGLAGELKFVHARFFQALMKFDRGDGSFKLGVEHVFYITTLDRVIVIGTVSSGSLKPADNLIVRND
jgi:hypothetical protein